MISSIGTVRCASSKSVTSASVRARASRKSSKRKSLESVLIVSPPSKSASSGNAVTARRYKRIFQNLGLRCRTARAYAGQDADVLVALHARKSAESVLAYRAAYPRRRIVLVLTGTDVYRDIGRSAAAVGAMHAADALVVLQPEALRELPAGLRRKARAIVQSSPARAHAPWRRGGVLTIAVLGHLRAEKDPMRAAYAVRDVDPELSVRVVHAGALLSPRFEEAVMREQRRNRRYVYLGELPRAKALSLLARCDVLVQSSRLEGGANTVCEAIACGTPVLASRIPGNTGILGRAYPGLYERGDTRALAHLIERAASSDAFFERLRRAVSALAPLVQPTREARAWQQVVNGHRSSRLRVVRT